MLATRPNFCALVAIALATSGCANVAVVGAIPLSTYKRMWSFDIAKVDLAGFRVAARLPNALEPTAVKVKIDFEKDGVRRHEELRLVPAREPEELGPLQRFARTGFTLFVYRLGAEDSTRLEKLRSDTEKGRGGHGSLSVGVDSCRHAPLPSGPLLITTILRTDASGYFVMFDDLDLRAVVSESELAGKITTCG